MIGQGFRFKDIDEIEREWERRRRDEIDESISAKERQSKAEFDSRERDLNREAADLERQISQAEDTITRQLLNAELKNITLQVAQIAELRAIREEQHRQARLDEERYLQQLRRDFASWRQTREGQVFVQWANIAGPLASMIYSVGSRWETESKSIILQYISPEEISRAQKKRWVERPALGSAFYTTAGLALGTAVGVSVLMLRGMVHAPQWWALPIVIAAISLIILVQTKNSREWREQNQAKGIEESKKRSELFGFDPLSQRIPSPWTSDAHGYAKMLGDSALRAVTEHTHPRDLPKLAAPEFKNPEDFSFEPFRSALVRIRKDYL